MPGLTEIKGEILAEAKKGDRGPFDTVRFRHMRRLAEITGNHAAVYASCFVQKPVAPASSITNEDVHGFMDILCGADKGKGLDLILHSPGGDTAAAEGIANYLNRHFNGRRIRVIVPYMAMSAATMLACAADSVVMGDHSSLGPIDPQIVLNHGGHRRQIAAHSVVGEFNYLMGMGGAPEKQVDILSGRRVVPDALPTLKVPFEKAWADAVLARYPLGLLDACRRLIKKSEAEASDWLEERMFAGEPDGAKKAARLAKYLADHDHFMSHDRRISAAEVEGKGMKVERLEEAENGKMQDAVLSIFHALSHAFSLTRATKIIASDSGRIFARMSPSGKIPTRKSP